MMDKSVWSLVVRGLVHDPHTLDKHEVVVVHAEKSAKVGRRKRKMLAWLALAASE